MKKQSGAIMQPAKEAEPMLPASALLDRIEDMYNSIARRAFEVIDGRGRGLSGMRMSCPVKSQRCCKWYGVRAFILFPFVCSVCAPFDP
jgi:hypothetical protein